MRSGQDAPTNTTSVFISRSTLCYTKCGDEEQRELTLFGRVENRELLVHGGAEAETVSRVVLGTEEQADAETGADAEAEAEAETEPNAEARAKAIHRERKKQRIAKAARKRRASQVREQGTQRLLQRWTEEDGSDDLTEKVTAALQTQAAMEAAGHTPVITWSTGVRAQVERYNDVALGKFSKDSLFTLSPTPIIETVTFPCFT